ncbi:DUF4153 domain-containing protein [Sphingorhabdus arenilitoris]|uniref:DUF4153 domain-containing protein n=1 Tax=Sphingorhabdus arenilitoris TaxID=1490041 RepID=A0ABV8RC90_9SPHN
MTTAAFTTPRYSFLMKLLVAALLVTMGDIFFYQGILDGAGGGIFAAVWTAGAFVTQRSIWRDKRALAALFMAMLFAGAQIIDPSFLTWILFWCAISMAILLPSTAAFDDGWRWFQRLMFHAINQYVRPFTDWTKLRSANRRGHRRSLLSAWRILVLPVIGSGIFLLLFAQANPLISKFVDSISLPSLGSDLHLRLLTWALIFAAVWASLRPQVARHLYSTFDGTGDVRIAGVSVMSVTISLFAFNLLFAVQNISDIAFLWAGQGLPDGVTFAEYAHSGAYPLIATALLAGLFVLVTLRPGSATANAPWIRRLVVMWIVQNIFLVASSILRTLDYIEVYSLTQLRIAALAWMGLVAIGLALVCIRIFLMRRASWLINSNLAAALLLLTGYSFVDTGATAAHWNVGHAREVGGKGVSLDLCYLHQLGPSALLALITLEQSDQPLDPMFRQRVKDVRQDIMAKMIIRSNNGYWTYREAERLKTARILLKGDGMDRVSRSSISCDGLVTASEAPNVTPGNGGEKILRPEISAGTQGDLPPAGAGAWHNGALTKELEQ